MKILKKILIAIIALIVEPARIFLVKAPSLAPAKKEKVKDSRADFKLK